MFYFFNLGVYERNKFTKRGKSFDLTRGKLPEDLAQNRILDRCQKLCGETRHFNFICVELLLHILPLSVAYVSKNGDLGQNFTGGWSGLAGSRLGGVSLH